jgi:cytochrome c556
MTTNSKWRVHAACVLGAAALATAGLSVAADSVPDIVKTRQQHLKELGKEFKAIRDQAGSGAPDQAALKTSAKKVNDLAVDLHNWFPTGSGPQAGVKTDAKAEIWSDPTAFSAAAQKLVDATTQLSALADAGDVDGFKAQIRAVGGSCKNCHDKFRVPEEH